MKPTTSEAKAKEAYGKTLDKAIEFSFSYDAFESLAEAKEKGKYPSDEDILGFVNNKLKAAARADATIKALKAAGYEKPNPSDPVVIRENMVKSLMKLHDLSQDVAEKVLEAAQNAALAIKSAA